jgi:hypothetical protein
MQWEYAMPGMSSWMFISSILLLGLIAIVVWSFARWATQSHAHASLSAPLASPGTDTLRQRKTSGEMDAVTVPKRVHVTLLTVPQCGYSEEAKTLLRGLALEYPLTIDVMALRTSAGDRLALQGGFLFPPGLFLDGEPFSYGHVSEHALRQELARRSGARARECGAATDRRRTVAYSRSEHALLR